MNLKGTVYRQLYRGLPHLVFVQNPGGPFRLVGQVVKQGEDYVPSPIASPIRYTGADLEHGETLAAEYLAKTIT